MERLSQIELFDRYNDACIELYAVREIATYMDAELLSALKDRKRAYERELERRIAVMETRNALANEEEWTDWPPA